MVWCSRRIRWKMHLKTFDRIPSVHLVNVWWCVMMCDDVWWCVMMCDDVWCVWMVWFFVINFHNCEFFCEKWNIWASEIRIFCFVVFSYMLSHLFSKKISFHTFFLFTFLHHLLLLPEAVGSQNAAARRARHGHVLPLPRRDGGNKKRKKRSTEDL